MDHLKERNAIDFDKPEVSVNRISVVNLDEPWQQQFGTDFPECRLEEQAGMSREDLKFMKFAKKVFSQLLASCCYKQEEFFLTIFLLYFFPKIKRQM